MSKECIVQFNDNAIGKIIEYYSILKLVYVKINKNHEYRSTTTIKQIIKGRYV